MKKLLLICCIIVTQLHAADNLKAISHKPITIDFLKNHPYLIADVAELWWQGQGERQQYFRGDQRPAMKKCLARYLQDDRLPLCLIALHDGKPVAMVRLTDFWTKDAAAAPIITAHKEWSPWICSLIVKRAYYGQGISQKLLSTLEYHAQGLGYHTLYVGTYASAKQMYQECGYDQLALDTFKKEPFYVMHKSIDLLAID